MTNDAKWLLRFLCVAWLLGIGGNVGADSEVMPRPKVFVSQGGNYYFKLVPSPDFDEAKTQGYLYRVKAERDELVYQSNGWYSFTVLVSHDGRNLVRLGPWPRHTWPPDQTPALVFYSNGEPFRTYFVSDLIEDLANLQHSVSHYSWGGGLSWTTEGWDNFVQVKTVENRTIDFNIATGEIVE